MLTGVYLAWPVINVYIKAATEKNILYFLALWFLVNSVLGIINIFTGLETSGAAIVVVDMVEQGLDQPAQQALMAHLRRCGSGAKPLFLMTRSSAILDLAAVGTDEAILFCPANHSPPISVAPYPGAHGYEAVATCLASPDVRARTEGVIAWRPQVA